MEDDLDAIAGGQQDAIPWLSAFYFGNSGDDGTGLKAMVSDRLGDIDAREVNSIPIGVDADGVPVAARVGRFGPYVERGEDRASIPDDLPPDELTIDRAIELLSAPSEERELGTDPDTGLVVLAKPGRYGPYVQLGTPDDAADRPRTASLFQSMSLDTIGLEDALRLLSLPRLVGTHPDGEEITAQNGRYGPYLRKGSDSRSLEREEQIFSINLDEAIALYAQPKRRRGAVERPPLRELGDDPTTGRHMTLKDGRFGPYVTDGETNASLRKGDDVETLTVERASELLAERRAAGPPTKRGRRTAKKRATKKKATKKKAAKKSATRKPPTAG
jgi:DNA topoisomerase-1